MVAGGPTNGHKAFHCQVTSEHLGSEDHTVYDSLPIGLEIDEDRLDVFVDAG